MFRRKIIRYEDEEPLLEAKANFETETDAVRDRDALITSPLHNLLSFNLTSETKRPRPSYVQERLHDVFAEIGVMETIDELPLLRRASTRPNVENPKLETRTSHFNGVGLYVKDKQKIEPGEVLTEFPGPPKWIKCDKNGEIPMNEVTEYVFSLGPFKIPGVYGKYVVVWGNNIMDSADYDGPCRGHLINSSHPRLKQPRNSTNCVYGIYYNNFVLDVTFTPDITLYAIASSIVVGGIGPNPLYELRSEYHWCLAFHFGYWCLDKTCIDFIAHDDLGDNEVLVGQTQRKNHITFDPTAHEVLTPPYPCYYGIPLEELRSLFTIHKCALDGNCLFRALSRGIYEREREWKRIKEGILEKWRSFPILQQKLVKCLEKEGQLDAFEDVLRRNSAWGTLDHLIAAQHVFGVGVYVWCRNVDKNDPTGPYQCISMPDQDLGNVRKIIHLLHDWQRHYDFLIPNRMAIPSTPAAAERCNMEVLSCTQTGTHSLARSSSISTTSSTSSRMNNATYVLKLCNTNIYDDIRNRLGKGKHRCCSKGCLKFHIDANGLTMLQSDIFEDVTAVYNGCRQEQSRRKEQERGSWVLEQYRASFTTTTTPSGRINVLISPYVVLSGGNIRLQVCRVAFDALYGVSCTMKERYTKILKAEGASSMKLREMKIRMAAVLRETPEIRQLTSVQYSCIAFIRNYCSTYGEKISITKQIRIAFPKGMVRKAYLNTFQCHLVGKIPLEELATKRPGRPVCRTTFYALWREYCGNVVSSRKKKGFAICHTCKQHTAIDCDPTLSNEDKRNNREAMAAHLKDVELSKLDYYERQQLASDFPNNCLGCIIDACDCEETELPNIKVFSKKEDKYKENLLSCKMFGVRIHGYRKRDYMWLMPPFIATEGGTNMTLEVLFRTLKLEESYYKENGLKWPKTFYLQLDNTGKENKNSIMWAAASYLVSKGLFTQIEINFLPVGHTHEDIDQSFSVITRALETTDAYTYPQWEKLVYGAYNDEWNSIKHVEMVWSILDYKGWLANFMKHDGKGPYEGYRSTAFHFLFYKESNIKLLDDPQCPWVMKYAKFSFHKKEDDFEYFPRPDVHPLLSWLREEPFGEPDLQNPSGLWYDRCTDDAKVEKKTEVDRTMALSKIVELLKLPSNAAKEEDITWWRCFFDMIPSPTNPLPRERQWTFSLPNPENVNSTAKYTSVDLRQLDDVRPNPAPKTEFLLSKYLTRAQKRDTLKLLEDMEVIDRHVEIEDNTFLIFRTGPDWAELGKEQEGMDDTTTSLPFTLAKTVSSKRQTPSSPAMVCVEIWYPLHGDPNSMWSRWERKRDDGKGSPWILEIDRDTILLVDPKFQDRKGLSKVLTAKTKQELALVPGLGYSYLAGKDGGLLPTDEVERKMKIKQKALKGSTSLKGIRKEKTLQTKVLHHHRTQAILKRKLLENNMEGIHVPKKMKT